MRTATQLAVLSACALAAHMAQAQSSVQIYGLLDVGLTHVTNIKGSGTVNQMSSGIMEGSRLGFKGTEELGGGYKTVFSMESRFESNTGGNSNRPLSGLQLPDNLSSATALGLPSALNAAVTAVNYGLDGKSGLSSGLGVNTKGTLFDRQLYVGMITPYGAVLAGRQYTPAYEVVATFDSMQTQSALGAGQVASFPSAIDIRLSNTVQYRIQQGGLTASLMYGATDTTNAPGRKSFYGAMAMYTGEGYSVGVGYNTRKNELGQKSLTNTTLGASLAAGPGTISMAYAHNKDDNPSDLSSISTSLTPVVGAVYANAVQSAYINAFRQSAHLFHIGYKVPFGPHTVTVSYNVRNDTTAQNADVKSYGVAYTYALSKRTDLNAVIARVDNSAQSQIALGGNAYLGGFTSAPGVDSTSVALGLRHRF